MFLTDEQWRMPTPADGWTIADQVSHLAYFDEAATLSITDADAFREAPSRTSPTWTRSPLGSPPRIAAVPAASCSHGFTTDAPYWSR